MPVMLHYAPLEPTPVSQAEAYLGKFNAVAPTVQLRVAGKIQAVCRL